MIDDQACCAPARRFRASVEQTPSPADVGGANESSRLRRLEGGRFRFGSEDSLAYPQDGESPVRSVDVGAFAIDPTCVTNARFSRFVDATGHVTDSERCGASFVFGGLLPEDFPPTRAVAAAPWWREVIGADWRHPEGPASDFAGREEHPVVHVSWNDATAFCAWAGLRLPSETEWEYAARGGLDQQPFPWGDELVPDGEHRMNVWNGSFPDQNTREDGYLGTCPVDAFPPNGYGLFNMTGNVWEWTADRFEPGAGTIVLRGGSYLCHASYCRRYRVSARMANTPESAAGNIGFRCAGSA
jgi:formylglycine-generating enzyme required for sulfatase activity